MRMVTVYSVAVTSIFIIFCTSLMMSSCSFFVSAVTNNTQTHTHTASHTKPKGAQGWSPSRSPTETGSAVMLETLSRSITLSVDTNSNNANTTTAAPMNTTAAAPVNTTTTIAPATTAVAPPPSAHNYSMTHDRTLSMSVDPHTAAPMNTSAPAATTAVPMNTTMPATTNGTTTTVPTGSTAAPHVWNHSMTRSISMSHDVIPPTTTTAFTCPSSNPVMCWDKSCALTSAGCRCTSSEARCSSNGLCVANVNNRTLCPCPSGTSLCSDNSCASSCTVACSGNQIRCADGTCQADRSACECPPRQWETATITVDILSGSQTEIDATTTNVIGSTVTAYACGAERAASGSTDWTVTDNTDVSKSFTSTSSSTVTLSPRNLVAGHEYTVTAVTTLTYPLAAASSNVKGSKTWSFKAVEPGVEVRILGGDIVAVPTTSNLQLIAQVNRGSVAQTSYEVVWTCKCSASNTNCTACPSAITTAFADLTLSKLQITDLTSAAPGSYDLYATAGGVTSAKQQINIVVRSSNGGATPPLVSILNIPSVAQLRGSESFSIFARTDKAQGTSFSWTIDNAAQNEKSNVLVVSPSSLSSGANHTIAVTATRSGLDATASVTFYKPAPVTGTCSVVGTTSPIVGLQTRVTVSSSWSNTASSALEYTFSSRSSGTSDESPIVPYASLATSLSFTAPLPSSTSSAETIAVVVRAMDRNSGIEIASTTCNYQVSPPPTTWVETQLVANASQRIEAAQNSGDFTTLLDMARDFATASAQTSNDTAKVSLQENSVVALDALNKKGANTRQEREGCLNVISQIVNANSGSSSSSSRSDKEKAVANSAIDLVLRVVTPPSGGSSSSGAIDSKRGGKAALDILSNLVNGTGGNETTAEKFTQSCNYIAQAVASQAQLGVTTTVQSNDGTLKAVGRSAPGGSGIGGFSLNFTESNITLPDDMNIGDASQKVSIGAAVWSNAEAANKKGGNAKQGQPTDSNGKKNCISSVVDYTISLDGSKQSVSGLSSPISIDLETNSTDTNGQPVDSNSLDCYFYDNGNRAWSKNGVSNGPSSNAETDGLHYKKNCKTTHLTQFAIFVSASASSSTTTASPSSGGGNAPSDEGTDVTPIAVGASVGGLVLIVIIVLVVRNNKNNGSTGSSSSAPSGGAAPVLVVPGDQSATNQSPYHAREMQSVGASPQAYHLNAVQHAPPPRRAVTNNIDADL